MHSLVSWASVVFTMVAGTYRLSVVDNGGNNYVVSAVFIYLFGVLRRFQHCTGHIMTGSWKGRGNQYIQLVKVLYCKLPTNGKQVPAFPLEVGPGTESRS